MIKNVLAVAVLCFVSLLCGFDAHAQTPSLSVPYDRAYLSWTMPTLGPSDGVPTFFQITCGTKVTQTTDTKTEIALSAVVPGPGNYTCTVQAGNQFGLSAPASSPTFAIGYAPPTPTGLKVEVR